MLDHKALELGCQIGYNRLSGKTIIAFFGDFCVALTQESQNRTILWQWLEVRAKPGTNP
jgi:hypothetical protein